MPLESALESTMHFSSYNAMPQQAICNKIYSRHFEQGKAFYIIGTATVLYDYVLQKDTKVPVIQMELYPSFSKIFSCYLS